MPSDPQPPPKTIAEEFAALQAQYHYLGRWAPIFLEPIVGSGERLVFAIAARGQDGRSIVSRVIRPEVIKIFYGRKAKPLGEMLTTIEAAVLQALEQGAESPVMPVDGFLLGPYRNARGRTLEDLVEQGRMMCASLGAVSVEAQHAADAEEDLMQTTHWAERVQKHVLERSSDLAPFFGRTVIRKGSSIPSRFGFYNDYYVANFGVVRRANPAGSLYHLKPRLWDLQNAKADLAGEIRGRDLLLARPDLRAATVSLAVRNLVRDVIDRVEKEADQHGIYVLHTDRVEQASRRLYQQARKLAA